jgi:hypothetical protein
MTLVVMEEMAEEMMEGTKVKIMPLNHPRNQKIL